MDKRPSFETTIDDCDVHDKTRLVKYRECFTKWGKWFGRSKATKNTILYEYSDMITNDFIFQGLNQAGLHQNEKSNTNNYLADNSSLARFVVQSYFSYQYMAIRRLVDKGKDTHSLRYLIENMQQNEHNITREVFVCNDGLPYDYKTQLDSHYKKCLSDKQEWHTPSNAQWSGERHRVFDELSKTTKDNRKRNDRITADYWVNVTNKLNIEAINHIKYYTDTFLAHALNYKKVDRLHNDNKVLSIPKIKECHEAIGIVIHQLSNNFWFTCFATEPCIINNNIIYNMDKPFADKDTIIKTKEKLDIELQKYRNIYALNN